MNHSLIEDGPNSTTFRVGGELDAISSPELRPTLEMLACLTAAVLAFAWALSVLMVPADGLRYMSSQLAQSAAADVFALKIAQSGGLFATAKVANG